MRQAASITNRKWVLQKMAKFIERIYSVNYETTYTTYTIHLKWSDINRNLRIILSICISSCETVRGVVSFSMVICCWQQIWRRSRRFGKVRCIAKRDIITCAKVKKRFWKTFLGPSCFHNVARFRLELSPLLRNERRFQTIPCKSGGLSSFLP